MQTDPIFPPLPNTSLRVDKSTQTEMQVLADAGTDTTLDVAHNMEPLPMMLMMNMMMMMVMMSNYIQRPAKVCQRRHNQHQKCSS